ncbi:MAG: hypothetical protein M3331_00065 [Actinomycetota bacterium]|nr:hypothetical protein [Actinomycetota bacterium]
MLMAAMCLGAAVVVAYALLTRPNPLLGDQSEYDVEGRFFDQGKLWWSTVILEEPHATAWKSPLYPAWVGFWYELLGPGPTKLAASRESSWRLLRCSSPGSSHAVSSDSPWRRWPHSPPRSFP